MIKTRKNIAIFMCAAMLTILCACGEEDPNAGLYTCTKVEAMGMELDPAELYPDGATLELRSGGGGKLLVDGDGGAIKWTLDGTDFTLDTDGEKSHGTLENGVLTLELLSSGVTMTMVKDGATLNAALPTKDVAAQTPQPEDSAYRQWWSGDWYGWWIVENSTGEFADTWYDCCASVELDDDGLATVTLWDEDTSKAEPMAVVVLRLSADGSGEMGSALSEGGWFWYSDVAEGDWTVDPGVYAYDNMFIVEDAHHEGEGESFDYSIYLRPWGQSWEDIEADDSDMLPYYYKDWYLPLIKAGAAMPDSMSDAVGEGEQ